MIDSDIKNLVFEIEVFFSKTFNEKIFIYINPGFFLKYTIKILPFTR